MRVLIAYDGSSSAAIAVRAAAGLFPGAQASLAVVPHQSAVRAGTAVPALPGTSPAAVQETLDALGAEDRRQAGETAGKGVEQARALGLEAEPVAVHASAAVWAALLDAAHAADADVLICGTRGRGAFTRALLGSTSSSLLHHTDIPLLVVPDGGGALDGPLLVAYDGSEGAGRAIEAAGRLLTGRATVVVHGWEPVSRRRLTARAHESGSSVDDLHEVAGRLHDALAEGAEATMAEGVAAARAAGLDAVGETVESDHGVWRALAAAAREHRAAVIAIGTRGLGATRSVLVGSVSSGLVQNAEVPVLVVPG